MHIRFFGNSTNASQKQKKQKKHRFKKEKRKTTPENGLSSWEKYQIIMASLPNILFTVIVGIVLVFMALGILPPSSVLFLVAAYLK